MDNSKVKNGLRLYGTRLKVRHPDSVPKDEQIMIVLRCGTYDDEIRRDLHCKFGHFATIC